MSLVLVGVSWLLSACGVDRTLQATQIALHDERGTALADQRETATYAADERLVTLEFLATAGTQAISRQRQIITTLNALGVVGDVNQITPRPTLTPTPDLSVASMGDEGTTGNASAPFSNPPGGAPEIRGGVTLLPATPEFRTRVPTEAPTSTPVPDATPTFDPNMPNFTNVVTATQIGSNDCAVPGAVTSEFTPNSPEIYVVGVANRMPAGTRLSTRWFRGEEQLALFEFTPNFAIDGNCVWFFADTSDFAFEPFDDYRIALEINGQAFGVPVRFSIREP